MVLLQLLSLSIFIIGFSFLILTYFKLSWEYKEMSQGFDLLLAKVNELKTVNDQVLAVVTMLKNALENCTTLEESQTVVNQLQEEIIKMSQVLPQ